MTQEICFACGDFNQNEWHHILRKVNDPRVVPLCVRCHNYVDRILLDKWPPGMAYDAFCGIWAKISPTERLMLLKMIALFADAIPRPLPLFPIPPEEAIPPSGQVH